MQVISGSQSLNIEFGGEISACVSNSAASSLQIKMPLLAGSRIAPLLGDCDLTTHGAFLLGASGDRIAGVACVEIDGALEDPAFQIYRSLLNHVGERQIQRVWNYVPHINQNCGALENYRAFNIGRHRAFEDRFGELCTSRMSPASAVGVSDKQLSVAFIAGEPGMQNVENPEQTPAYQYPAEHGPKSPSFTRGAHGIIEGTPVGYLSGTSSIKDHRSIGGSTLGAQFGTTIDNIRIVLERMGYADALEGSKGLGREFSFYLRHADDLGAARERFRHIVGDEGIAVTRFLQADICREELLLEIEGTFWRK